MPVPMLSAILIHSEPARFSLCQKAVNNFIRQHYVPFELIIVNTTEQDVVTNKAIYDEEYEHVGCFVKEIKPQSPQPNAAAMRNCGLRVASGDWVVAVDDDDWFHPQRFLYQMAHRYGSVPCLLRNQLKIDISRLQELDVTQQQVATFRPMLYVDSREQGVPNTMIFPRLGSKTKELWLYNENLKVGEHDELLQRITQEEGQPVVCRNQHTQLVNGMSWPMLSVAMYFGQNESTFEQFFQNLPQPYDPYFTPSELNTKDIEQLKIVLRSFNFNVS